MELLDRLKVRRMMNILHTPQRLLFPFLDLFFLDLAFSPTYPLITIPKFAPSLRGYIPRFLLSTS
jgi:hypothetical protein